MGTLINSAGFQPGATSKLSPPPAVPRKPEYRSHKKGKSSTASITFIGESYWRTRAAQLVSLEVASQTPSITKRGFEHMYHKSRGYRFTGGSLYFGLAPNLVRKSQRDVVPRGVAPTWHLDDSDQVSPPTMPVSSDQHNHSTIILDICGDSAKKVLKVSPLIPLEEAQQREFSRRNRTVSRALQKEVRIEREVSKLKREVAQIAWKKAQAKREEEPQPQVVGGLKRQDGPTLTAAVAAGKDKLVVAPTNWIVPLISLEEARRTEEVKRNATDTKSFVPLPSSPPSAIASVGSLVVNAANGSTTRLQLITLEEARDRARTRRLEGDYINSRT